MTLLVTHYGVAWKKDNIHFSSFNRYQFNVYYLLGTALGAGRYAAEHPGQSPLSGDLVSSGPG